MPPRGKRARVGRAPQPERDIKKTKTTQRKPQSQEAEAGLLPYTCIRVPRAGGYDVLNVEKAEGMGTRGPNIAMMALEESQLVVVDTAYAGVNYADVCVRWGLYASAKEHVGWPITPGFEFAGTVVSVGRQVTKYKKGDVVYGVTMFGGYSSRVQVPEHQLFMVPKQLSLPAAASFPTVALTAWYALHTLVAPRKGSTLLVHSCAGGVGSMLVQLGKIAGCKVVGVVGATHKVKYAREVLKCDVVVDKSAHTDWWHEVSMASPGGYAGVFDANGVSTLQQSYEHLGPEGRLVTYGFHSMLPRSGGRLTPCQWGKMAWQWLRRPVFDPMDMVPANKSILAFNLSFLFDRVDVLDTAMAELHGHLAGGRLVVPPPTVYPLSSVAQAHEAIESGSTVGKLVLQTTA